MQEVNSTTTASDVIPFTGKEQAPNGFRVISLHWKERKATDTKPAVLKRASVSLLAPTINIAVEPQTLQQACQDAVNELQDALARSIVEADAAIKFIPFQDLSHAAIVAFASAVSTSKRLNSAAIVGWFDTNLQDALMAALTKALNITDANDLDMTKLVRAVEVYRNSFAELAAPKPSVTLADAEKLLRWAQKATDQESPITASILNKLNLITKRTQVELLI